MLAFMHSPTHGPCKHEQHVNLITLARCAIERETKGIEDDVPCESCLEKSRARTRRRREKAKRKELARRYPWIYGTEE